MIWTIALTDIALIIICGALLYITKEIEKLKLTAGYLISKTLKKEEIIEVDTEAVDTLADELAKSDQGGTDDQADRR